MDQIRVTFSRNIQRLQHQMDQMLDNILSSSKLYARAARRAWRPSVDMYETQEELVITVEIAGVDKEDIRVEVESDLLRITGQRKELPPAPKIRLHLMEIDYGEFERILHLGVSFDPEKIRASYRNGLLEVRVTKLQTSGRDTYEVEPG